MISHRYRCIYVKVPKCASTSVLDWFVLHGGGRHSYTPYWYGGILPDRVPSVTRLMNLYPGYATVSFVRDPFERFVSLYLHATRYAGQLRDAGGAHPGDYGTLRDFAELCRDLLEDCGSLWGREARAFFRAHGEREYGPGKIKLRHLRLVAGHAWPQTAFLPDCNGQRLFGVTRVNDAPLSFIGRVENMEADWRRLTDMLGLPAVAVFKRNASGAGVQRRNKYRACYDDATRRLVEEIYAADLDFTGCGFDDGRMALAVGARPGPRPARRGRPGTVLARAWHRLRAFEVALEERLLRRALLRRILRPLGRLRVLAATGRMQ